MKCQSAGAAWQLDSRNTAERHPTCFTAVSMSLHRQPHAPRGNRSLTPGLLSAWVLLFNFHPSHFSRKVMEAKKKKKR